MKRIENDNAAPSPSRGEEIMAAYRKAGGADDVAACVADLLAMAHVEWTIACGEARDNDDRYPSSIGSPEGVCEEAQSAVEVWIEDERRAACRDEV